MKFLQKGLLATGLFFGAQLLMAQMVQKIDTNIFPKPQKGMVQYVIEVPHSSIDEDSQKKVEIFVGKYEQTDTCNRQFLNGELEKKDLKGWGYTYYQFKTNGQSMTTLMGCPNTETITKFVTAQPYLTDYNGRMPIVIYVPEGYEVQYKIYKAEPESFKALEVTTK